MMITVSFEDFKRICDEYSKRLYYYLSDDLIELYFISDGIFVKSFVDLKTIDNKEVFFGDKIFTGAIKLLFKLPSPNETSISVSDAIQDKFKKDNNVVEENENVEAENPDIQKDSVAGEPKLEVQ